MTSAQRENHNDHIDVMISIIVNEKLDAGNNYLHHLVEQMTKANFAGISEAIKVLVVNKCSLNSPNHRFDTPFLSALKKLRSLSIDRSDLIEFFIHNSSVDFHSYKREEIAGFMVQYNFVNTTPLHGIPIRDVNYMNHLLEQWQEEKFIEEFEEFESEQPSDDFERTLLILLETAVTRNMRNVVTLLLTNVADVDGIPKDGKFNMPAVFIACLFGHHRLLKDLMVHSTLDFHSVKTRSIVLDRICFGPKVNEQDRWRCFEVMLVSYFSSSNGIIDEENAMDLEIVQRKAAHDYSSNVNQNSEKALRDLRQIMTNFYLPVDMPEEEADDSRVELIVGDSDSDFGFDEKYLRFRRLERLAWYIFVALMALFVLVSIFGITRNIIKGSAGNESDVLESGFTISMIESLSGGRVKPGSDLAKSYG